MEWVVVVRSQIVKLTARNAVLLERSIRSTVLRVLGNKPKYKTKVKIIKHTQLNIALVDL